MEMKIIFEQNLSHPVNCELRFLTSVTSTLVFNPSMVFLWNSDMLHANDAPPVKSHHLIVTPACSSSWDARNLQKARDFFMVTNESPTTGGDRYNLSCRWYCSFPLTSYELWLCFEDFHLFLWEVISTNPFWFLAFLPAFPVTLWRLFCYYEPVSLQLVGKVIHVSLTWLRWCMWCYYTCLVICFDFPGCDTRLPSALLGVYPPPQQLFKTFSPLRWSISSFPDLDTHFYSASLVV